jgi:predicted nucleotidyltransferase
MNRQLPLTPRERTAVYNFVQTIQANYLNQIDQVVLFGSKARGDDTPESDIDILVVLRDNDWRLCDAIRTLGARVSLKHDVLLSIRAVSPDKWTELARYQFPLYRAIQTEGIVLFAPEHITIG